MEDNIYTSMSITSAGLATLPDQKKFVAPLGPPKDINSVADIEGASAKVPYGDKYNNKPCISNADIEKSCPAPLMKSRNVKDLSLHLDDIEGTRHTVRDRMMRTSRHVNPLNPDYQLPSCNPIVVEVPKFIRDSHDVRDIDGARAKPAKQVTPRDIMSNADVVGAQAGWKPRHKKIREEAPPHPIMIESNAGDLKNKRFEDRSNRITNPVDPVYMVNGTEVKNDEGSKPKPLPKYIPESYALRTDDIAGAQYGFKQMKRREYRNTMYNLDVEGAQADTIFHTIQTKRVVDPLNPVYTNLDGSVCPPSIKPLLPPQMAGVPTLRPSYLPGNFNANTNINTSDDTSEKKVVGQMTSNDGSYSARSFADKFKETEGARRDQENVVPKLVPQPASASVSLPQINDNMTKLELSKVGTPNSGERTDSGRGSARGSARGSGSLRKAAPMASVRAEAEKLAEIAAVREL